MLLRQTILYMPAQLVGPALQFIAVIAWTFWLPPSVYGVVAQILAAQELVFQAALSWWSHYAIRYYAGLSEEEQAGRYQRVENAVLLLSIVLQIAATVLVLILIDSPDTPALFLAASLYIVTRSLLTHLAERARALHDIPAYTIAQAIGPLFGFLLGLAGLSAFGASAEIVLGAFAVVQGIALPLIWMRLGLGAGLSTDRTYLRAAARYGLPLLVSGVIGWVSVNGIRLIVDAMEGASAVGLVSVGWALGQRLISVAAMLVTAAAFPLAVQKLADGTREESLAQVSRNGALLAAVLVPATAGAIAVSAPLVNLLIGPEYREVTAAILPVALLSGAIRNLRVHFADQVFLLTERPRDLLWINLGEAIVTVAGCAIGLRYGGLVGACIGCLAGHTVGAVACFALAILRFGLHLPLADLARIAAVTAIMVVCVSALPGGASPLFLILAVALGVAVYGAAMIALYWPQVRRAVRRS